jgi:transcriptional regulator with XRE-family HTH domain
MTPKSFDDLYREAEEHDDYWVGGIALELTEAVTEIMERDGISRSELARRLGTSPAYVTKMLRGNANFTLTTMSRLARALGADLQIQLLTPAKSELKEEAETERSGGGSSPSLHRMVAAPRQS